MTLAPVFSAPLTVATSFLGNDRDGTSKSAYTFSGKTLGGTVALVVGYHDSASSSVWDSITIGGVAATQVIQFQDTAAGSITDLAIYIAQGVPATGDIVVNLSAAVNNCEIGWFRLDHAEASAHATDRNAGDGTNESLSIDVPQRGAVIAAVMQAGSASYSWNANVTKRWEQGSVQSGASEDYEAAQTGLTIEPNGSSTSARSIAIAASFGPVA